MTLSIDVWSDIACPWCWVGKRHLEKALDGLGEECRVTWRAFELDPAAPRQADPSVPYAERLARKYRVSTEQGQAMIDRMTATGRTVGIDFRFDRVQPTNTFDAHRLLCWAEETKHQNALKESLLEAYMTDGASVADHAVLVDRVAQVGLDAEAAQMVLESDDFADAVRREQNQAREMGVHGVPFFKIGTFGVSGAQPPETLRHILERAAQTGVPAVADAEVCGPDGCAVP